MGRTPPVVQVALLRAVNVGGSGKVSMAALVGFLERRGFTGVRTILQTGNLILPTAPATGDELARLLEKELAAGLKLTTEVFVRSAPEWTQAVAANPFRDAAERDPRHLVLVALAAAPTTAAVAAVRAAVTGPETVEAVGRHLYVTYPDGIGRSRLTGALIERKLAVRGTARNWNTVLKVAAALAVDAQGSSRAHQSSRASRK